MTENKEVYQISPQKAPTTIAYYYLKLAQNNLTCLDFHLKLRPFEGHLNTTYLQTYLQSNYSTDDIKNHQNGMSEHLSNYWWCGNMSSWSYSRNFLIVAPRSVVGPHFRCIIMAIEGGNSTEAT